MNCKIYVFNILTLRFVYFNKEMHIFLVSVVIQSSFQYKAGTRFHCFTISLAKLAFSILLVCVKM